MEKNRNKEADPRVSPAKVGGKRRREKDESDQIQHFHAKRGKHDTGSDRKHKKKEGCASVNEKGNFDKGHVPLRVLEDGLKYLGNDGNRLNFDFENETADEQPSLTDLIKKESLGARATCISATRGADPSLPMEEMQDQIRRAEEMMVQNKKKKRRVGTQKKDSVSKKTKYADDSDSATEEMYKATYRGIARSQKKARLVPKKKVASLSMVDESKKLPETLVWVDKNNYIASNPEEGQAVLAEKDNEGGSDGGEGFGESRVGGGRAEGDKAEGGWEEEGEEEENGGGGGGESLGQMTAASGSGRGKEIVAAEPTCFREDKANPFPMQKLFYPVGPTPEERERRQCVEKMYNVNGIFEKYLHVGESRPEDFIHIRELMAVAPQNAIPTHAIPYLEKFLENIETWRRADEEEQLFRTPIGNERQCVNDKQCEGMKIEGTIGVILKEACSVEDVQNYIKHGVWPEVRRPCRMCSRKAINSYYFNLCGNKEGLCPESVIHNYCNIINTKGEYAAQDVILSSSTTHLGLFGPVPIHCRLWYRQTCRDGVYYFEQSGYAKPETDCIAVFQRPPGPDLAGAKKAT